MKHLCLWLYIMCVGLHIAVLVSCLCLQCVLTFPHPSVKVYINSLSHMCDWHIVGGPPRDLPAVCLVVLTVCDNLLSFLVFVDCSKY